MKRLMEFPREESETPKKLRNNEKEESVTSPLVPDLGEDLILEVLKLADAETLARAACVSRRWREITADERIWEAVCTRGWARLGCGAHQMRVVVNALGGYKKLHSVYLLPLLQPKCIAKRGVFGNSKEGEKRWGKDEVQLSMALLSIGFFEKMTATNFKR